MEVSQTDSLILFRNSRGLTGRGTLVHITRNVVVFEVYNPYSIVQLSEVLKDLQILRGERTIYSGRAVVSNLVTTGLMTIVSTTLVDPWSDLAGLTAENGLRNEMMSFLKGWETSHTIRPGYQVIVGKMRGFLAELSRWLEQVEVASASPDESGERHRRQMELYSEAEAVLLPKITELFQNFEFEAGQVDIEGLIPHRTFARRELHPLTMCSPFVHRTYTKPLGYAGDYEMVNMMLRDPAEGVTTYAKLVNAFNIKAAPVEAHRNRIDMLQEILQSETMRAVEAKRPIRILNVGCGPAAEIQRFVKDSLCERCEFNLMDFNEETIEYAKARIDASASASRTRPTIRFIHRSVDELLKESTGVAPSTAQPYDLIYCAGLFDYFAARTCKRLVQMFYSWAAPGGLVVTTNVHSNNPVKNYMEHVLEWHLFYRDNAGMAALAPEQTPATVRTDATGVNLFLEIRKPQVNG